MAFTSISQAVQIGTQGKIAHGLGFRTKNIGHHDHQWTSTNYGCPTAKMIDVEKPSLLRKGLGINMTG